MSYRKKCCVHGCNDEISSRHRFPLNKKDLLEIWIERVGQPLLHQFSQKTLYNCYFVCSSHFIKECLNGNRLVTNSLPTINLPGFTDKPTVKNSFWDALQLSREIPTNSGATARSDNKECEH